MKQVTQVLKLAKGFIEQGWTQRAFARDRMGGSIDSNDPKAVKWCPLGAISKANSSLGPDVFETDRASDYLRKAAKAPSIVGWNDAGCYSKFDVLKAFTKAIELSKASK